MNRPRRRRLQRSRRRQTIPQWLLWTVGGSIAAVALVIALLVAIGAFGEKEGAPSDPIEAEYLAELVATGWSMGSPSAPVSVVEFGDFQCPHCERFWSGPLRELKKEFVETGQARLVYRHMIVVGPESALAAVGAECAGDQGQFFPYHDLLFENQGPANAGYITAETLVAYAVELGLDEDRFAGCLASPAEQYDKVVQSTERAEATGVRGTPTVLINGRRVQDPLDLEDLRALILDELERRR